MRTGLLTQMLAILLVLVVRVARAEGGTSPAFPRCEMPGEAYRILLEAVKVFPKDDLRQTDWLERNTTALGRMRKLPWPDLRQAKLARLHSQKEPDKYTTAWYVPSGDDALTVLLPNFTEAQIAKDKVTRIEPRDFAEELAALVEYLDKRDPEARRPWDFTLIHDFGAAGLPHHGGVFLLHNAYAAAYFGKSKEATRLVHEAIRQRGLCFEDAYNEAAWQSFAQGIAMLRSGTPRSELLNHWKETLRVFDHSRYHEQLTDLTSQLEKQVVEDQKLAGSDVEDPGKLPLPQRINYYIARLPDVHGAQWSQPGHCVTYGMGEGTQVSDALIKIGRPAVPKLIEHLDDRRLTRSIGFWRNFAPSRVVLRVQDVAVQCIEQIVDIRFYHSSSTSSYLSNEKEEKRRAVVEDIKEWWTTNGSKTPLEGYLARMDRGNIYDRLAVLGKIESIDKTAVDSIATLNRWAAGEDFRQLPKVAEALARRGDLSLLPAMREMARDQVREIPSECIWFLLKYGTTEDYRMLREATREDIRRGATLGSSRVFASVKAGIENSKNPLVVPILVDLLDRREISGSRSISREQGSMGFSCADTCIGALIRLVGHDPGYQRGDPFEKRYAAIDRWEMWWQREGKAAFLEKHPEARKVLGEGPQRVHVIDGAALPGLVEVAGANPGAPISYRVPKEDLNGLAKAGKIIAEHRATGELTLRFVSHDAAMTWFDAARPLPGVAEAQQAKVLERLALTDGTSGVSIAPNGQVWLYDEAYHYPIDAVKKQVEQAVGAEVARVDGAKVVLVDRQGRIWIRPNKELKGLLAFDPKRKEWIERDGPTPEEQAPYQNVDAKQIRYMITGPAFESSSGRIYFGDRMGVHVLDRDQWHFQALYARNYRESRFYGDTLGFNPPQFSEGPDGRVYIWSGWGRYGGTGTVGFWVHDGKTWKNVDVVERVAYVQPSGRDGIWLFHDTVSLLHGEKHITGEEAQRRLHRNLRFRSVRPVCTGASGTVYLMLDDVTQVEPLLKEKKALGHEFLCRMWQRRTDNPVRRTGTDGQDCPPYITYKNSWPGAYRALALSTGGSAVDLGSEAGLFLNRICSHSRVSGPDGWIFGGCREGLEAMSPGGEQIKFPMTQRFATLQVKAVGPDRSVCFVAGGHWWRLNAAAKAATDALGSRLSAMVVQVRDVSFPDSLGRMWCTWNTGGSPTGRFDGRGWKMYPESSIDRQRGEPKGYISAFRGADGAMVFEDPRYRFHLFDDKGWVMGGSAKDLALQYPDRLRKALAWPPLPSINFYDHLVKDAEGRIWWGHWSHEWGMVDGPTAIDSKTAPVTLGPNRNQVLSVLYPIRNGSEVLAGDEAGAAAVLTVRNGRVVSVGQSPVRVDNRPHECWRHNVLRDRQGRVWVMNGRKSQAIGLDGKLVAEHDGWLLLEDRFGGLWFKRTMSRDKAIVRLTPDDAEAELPLADVAENACFTEAPDGTVWTLTLSELIRVKAQNGKLSIVERYAVPVAAWDHVWCDAVGRVWMYHGVDRPYRELIRFATNP